MLKASTLAGLLDGAEVFVLIEVLKAPKARIIQIGLADASKTGIMNVCH